MKLDKVLAVTKETLQQDEDIQNIYEIGDQIGKGAYGAVYKAIHRKSGLERAIKKISKRKIGPNAKFMKSEFQNLMKLDHPNILKIFELYDSARYIFIVTELLLGE